VDDVSVYVEAGGEEALSELLRDEIAATIETLIQNGTPDLSKVIGEKN
jgi:hypothetical protein